MKLNDAKACINDAIDAHKPARVFALFSGGHDSLTATTIASQAKQFDGVVHINTGIGIEETRQFVRDTCRARGWPLTEMFPDGKTFDDLVLEKGFPRGPKSHNSMYYWLKQRQVRRLVRQAKTKWGDRIALVTGVRIEESRRRMLAKMAVPTLRIGAQLWVNPILNWTVADCSQLIADFGLQRNPVVDFLHRSGECLCGAFANASEIKEIQLWYPNAARRIAELEQRCHTAGLVDCVWAGASKGPGRRVAIPGLLCAGCGKP